MKYPTLRSSEFRMTYDEYDLQIVTIVTIDVYPRLCKCDYKLITLRDLPWAPLHRHKVLLTNNSLLLALANNSLILRLEDEVIASVAGACGSVILTAALELTYL